MPRRALVALAALVCLAACGGGPEEAFEAHAVPVLEARCATARCHGVPPGATIPAVGFFVAIDARGRLSDPVAARAMARTRITTTAPFWLSSLVRTPLARVHAGGPHAGGEVLSGPDDPRARELGAWIDAEPEGTGGEDVVFTELELRFARDVLPVVVRRCGFAGCHGPTEVANTALPARVDPTTGTFAPLEVRRARATLRKFVDLWGADVTRSRLVRKALGAAGGGLPHRGGPGTFFPEAPPGAPLDAPELAAILGWARAERAALGVTDGRTPTGVVYVRGPSSPRAPYRIAPERLGSDLWRLAWPPGSAPPENLTAALHPGTDVEVREPAVAHDGRRVAFAMRRGGEALFALYELDLETRAVRRVSPEGDAGSYASPVYGPDGRLVAAWDGHGEPSGDGPGVAPELVAFTGDGARERLTWTRAPEVRPGVLSSGKTRGMLVFGIRRDGPRGPESVLFRFPPCHDPKLHGEPEYHVQFGASLAPLAPLVARDLPDGRQVMIVLAGSASDDDRGGLVLLDRSLGPRLATGATPSTPGLLEPLAVLDSARRCDPAPLPDGRLLASTDEGRAPGDDALVVVAVEDGPAGARLAAVDTLAAEAGFAMRGAAVVLAHPLEDDGHARVTDPARDDARIAIRDATVLEMLYGHAPPTGVRPLRTDLAAVRVLVPARTDGLFAEPGARVLAEVPLAADHSAELRVPARTALRLEWLDASGMVVGSQLDRWYYGDGGELVPAGTNPETYAHACAGCHGALSGVAADATRPAPDVLSSASVTLSTHEGRDPRRPLPPTDVAALAPRDASFVATVAPILEARCAACHGGAAPSGGLSLAAGPGVRYAAAYEALVAGGYVDGSLRARRAPLVEWLSGAELDAPGSPARRCPPEGLPEAELRAVCRWIESGAAYREVPDAP